MMRRTKVEILLDILETLTLDGPLRVTWLMRKVNVPWLRLKPYLTFAVNNFIIDRRGTTYQITPLGVNMYKKYLELQNIVKKFRRR